MISRYLFSLLFFIAGMTHVFFPQAFDPAIAFFPYRDFINGLVGCLEVLLALSLWHSKLQDYAAQACALWLLILFPIHVS